MIMVKEQSKSSQGQSSKHLKETSRKRLTSLRNEDEK